jgi:hypothetical protein
MRLYHAKRVGDGFMKSGINLECGGCVRRNAMLSVQVGESEDE